MHAGRITVESALGSGPTFRVLLPRDPRAVEPGPGADADVAGPVDPTIAQPATRQGPATQVEPSPAES
jgi:hypothetical protein